jgi:ATPases involved in chromosome partitioning
VARESLDKAIGILKERFDYVILDTAPIGLVTDTQIISRVANVSVYVCRADYTTKAEYGLINYLDENKKLPNLCTIINGIDMDNKKYGYSYGYGKYGKYGRAYGYAKGYGYGYGSGYGDHHNKENK